MIDEKIFPFLAEKGHVISLVGGGGKTTLMYNLAAHCARKGWRVLAATTTHIMQPPGGVWAQTDAELFRLWKCGSYAVAGTAAHGGKLTAPPQAQLERWMTLADIVLIEADGAKRMPCKAPAAHEPVLLPQCDTVLAVAGLSALRHPLREVCFRAELAAELLCVPQDAQLTPELLANLLASEAGGRKAVGDRSFYVVLNQVDTKEQAALARQVADILKKFGEERGIQTDGANIYITPDGYISMSNLSEGWSLHRWRMYRKAGSRCAEPYSGKAAARCKRPEPSGRVRQPG